MKNLTIENITKVCGGKFRGDIRLLEQEIAGAVIDSREVKEGFLFLAIKGEKVDGHTFIDSVYDKGAVCVVCEKAPKSIPENTAYILVENTLKALKEIAEFYRLQLQIPIIGITGSVGKTSTKECIAAILEAKYKVLKTKGNFNNEIGLPLTILRIQEEHEVAVVEMGISDFGEMTRLSKIARPTIGMITNIGQCHLENLQNQEGILKAKSELFTHMPEGSTVILNGDDLYLNQIIQVDGCEIYRYGIGSGSLDAKAEQIVSLGLRGSKAKFHVFAEEYEADIALSGMHMVSNCIAGALVAQILEVPAKDVIAKLSKLKTIDGRNNMIKYNNLLIIDDCYNANPVSMKTSLDLLKTAEGRTVAILGDMFELGENSDALHKEVGEYAASRGIDVIVCIGENARYMYDGAVERKTEKQLIVYEKEKEEIKELLEVGKLLQAEDTILIKASHGMKFQELVQLFC